MIFHENKVKLSVILEKFAKVQPKYNERITFSNFQIKKRKEAETSSQEFICSSIYIVR